MSYHSDQIAPTPPPATGLLPPSKPRRRLLKFALALTSLVLTLFLVETLMRASGKFPFRDVHSVNTHDYDRIPGIWEPNQDFVSKKKHVLPYHVTINSLGLRGPETTLKPQKPRVLCIGDSFTYGVFVDNDETLPAQVQRFLGAGFEVLNAGVPGTTIVDQQTFLPKMLALEPDAVMLTYCEPNDLSDLFKKQPLHVSMAKNRKLKSGVLRPMFAAMKDTCLFRLALLASSARRVSDRTTANPQDPLLNLPEYVARVDEVRDMLKQRGIPFFFVVFPSQRNWTGLGSESCNIKNLLEALQEIDISGIDPSTEFTASAIPITELYCMPHDGHPAAKGYEICGRVAADALRSHFEQTSN